jgi:PAS domain S-box-containing protein
MSPVSQELSGTTVAALVRELKESILEHWRRRVLREVYAAGEQNPPALLDSLPDFLDQLAHTLGDASLSIAAERSVWVARTHGEQRARLPHYTLDQVVYEYQVLREVLVDRLEHSARMAPEPLRRLHAALDGACRESAVRFVEHSQAQLGRAERSTQVLERLLDQIFASFTGAMAYFAGPNFVYERVNAGYRELLGGRELVGRPVLEAVPELANSNFPALFQKIFTTGGTVFISEERVDLEDHGTGLVRPRYFDGSYSRIEDPEGRPLGIFHFATEVTERVAARQEAQRIAQALRVSEQRLADALAVIGAGIWEVDLTTQEVLADRRFREMFGLSMEESFSLAKGLAIIHPEDSPTVAAAVAGAIAGENGGSYEADYRTVPREDGSYQWVAARGQAYFDAQGKALRFLGTGVDITARKTTEALLVRQSHELKTRVDFEQKLIGIVSHDLRNPLSAIVMGASLLAAREDLDARATKSLVRIQTSADRATRMVKDLLDFTQARLGGGLKIEPTPTDLHRVTRAVVEEVEAAWPGRDLELRHEGDGAGDWDADRLAQVVQNLVTNALKYSPADSLVHVTTRAEDGEVSLCVANQGPPIPADKLSGIFEPLQRATAELDKAGRSVGLGLYIVKRIVDAHGGHIGVVSTAEDGTRFTVQLPRHVRPTR